MTGERAHPPELWAALALAVAASLWVPLNHDVAWYLVAARRLLDGAHLYVDVIDVNPPLVFWLSAVSAYCGRLLGLGESAAGHFAPVLLLIASALTGSRVLARDPAASRVLRSGVTCGFLVFGVFLQLADVGQRDQLAGLLMFPYALTAGRESLGLATPRGLAARAGLLAALGVALKPYFALPFLAAEAVVLARRRSLRALLRPEPVAVVAGQLVYLALVALAAPDYLARMVPLAAATYGAYDVSRLAIVTSVEFLAPAACVLCALGAALLLPRAASVSVEVLAALALGFLASFVVQAKGFAYHVAPALVFGPLGLGFAAARALGAARESARARAALALCVVGALALAPLLRKELAATRHSLRGYRPELTALADTLRAHGAGEPAFFLSTSVWPAFPVVNLSGARWPYRYNCLWPLPAFYRDAESVTYRPPEAQSPTEREFFDAVVADLVAAPPRVLVVDRSPGKAVFGGTGAEFEFVPYFSGSPAFVELLARYRPAGRVGAFELFVRP